MLGVQCLGFQGSGFRGAGGFFGLGFTARAGREFIVWVSRLWVAVLRLGAGSSGDAPVEREMKVESSSVRLADPSHKNLIT